MSPPGRYRRLGSDKALRYRLARHERANAAAMYHWVTEQQTRRAFHQLDQGAVESLVAQCRPDIWHHFPGEHPLGGTRRSVHGLRRWFGRLGRLFPELRFTIHDVLVAGPPWNTRVVVRWHDAGRLCTGEPYENQGMHRLRLRWGRLAVLEAHLDTQRVEQACRQMAAHGVAEAEAAPIDETHLPTDRVSPQ